MQGYESLIFALIFFFVVGIGGWALGILWRKLRPFPPGIKHIPIKEITQQGCMGEDGRLIPWSDIQAVVKEFQAFPNYSAEGSFTIVGHFKNVYRIVSSSIADDTHYELRNFQKSMFTSDAQSLAQARKEFNAKALLLLESAKVFPHIKYSSFAFYGRERMTFEKECAFLRKWPNPIAKRLIRAGGNARSFYAWGVFWALLLIIGCLLWLKW